MTSIVTTENISSLLEFKPDTLKPVGQDFIYNCCYLALGEELGLFSCKFDPNKYQDGLFEKLAIQLIKEIIPAVPKRKAEFLAGRFAAMKCLEYTGLLPFNGFQVVMGEHRSPVWPETVVGAISHNHSQALAIVGNKSHFPHLGIDIEDIMTPELAQQIQTTIHSHQEGLILWNAGLVPNIATSLIYSAKESIFKALYSYVGDYFGFEMASVCEISVHDSIIRFSLAQSLQQKVGKVSIECRYLLAENRVITLIFDSK